MKYKLLLMLADKLYFCAVGCGLGWGVGRLMMWLSEKSLHIKKKTCKNEIWRILLLNPETLEHWAPVLPFFAL